ncbi:erv26 super protein [Dimargaris verticillata]|uniref:Erv26 super protein n=1 Tax=Dimargaris verticillata TaxID=2761393 RepID=A0A9W8B6X1_9FUNG|nr:erv26 super protein [Dimargaris verticillata]
MLSALIAINVLGILLEVGFAAFCVVCGLYFISEVVEERTRLFKQVIVTTTWVVIACHALVWLFDGLSLLRIAFSLACQAVYSLHLSTFPLTNTEGFTFLATCVLVITNHFSWFLYFIDHHYATAEVVSFFVVCVWLVPLLYLVSLSSTSNQLPTLQTTPTAATRSKRSGLLKSWFGALLGKSDATPLPSPADGGVASSSKLA